MRDLTGKTTTGQRQSLLRGSHHQRARDRNGSLFHRGYPRVTPTRDAEGAPEMARSHRMVEEIHQELCAYHPSLTTATQEGAVHREVLRGTEGSF